MHSSFPALTFPGVPAPLWDEPKSQGAAWRSLSRECGGSWVDAGAPQLPVPGGRGQGCQRVMDSGSAHSCPCRGPTPIPQSQRERGSPSLGSATAPCCCRWVLRSCAPCSAKSSRSFTPSPPSTSWTAPSSTGPRRQHGTCPCTAVCACSPGAAPLPAPPRGHTHTGTHGWGWKSLRDPPSPPSPGHH